MDRTTITLIRVMQPYQGIYRYEARPSTAEEIERAQGVHDFQGKTQRIAVLPCGCEMSKEEALKVATRYSQQPFETLVDFQQYAQLTLESKFWKTTRERGQKVWKKKNKRGQYPVSDTTQSEAE